MDRARAALAACAVEEWQAAGEAADGQDGKADGPADGWTSVGYGVAYQRVNAGNAVLIAYGGYTARLTAVEAWASELVDAELGAAGVGRIYAVQGPRDAGYAARSLGSAYAPKATTFEVVVPSTGCANGAGWCLHDVVITHRPHNPWSYDLARDYTDFVGRQVTTEYLGPLLVEPPADSPPTDDWLTVDDDNANNDAAVARCERSSAWTSASSAPGYNGTGYAFATVQAVADPAVFWFYVDADGEREIQARWTAGTNRTDAAPFSIEDGDGIGERRRRRSRRQMRIHSRDVEPAAGARRRARPRGHAGPSRGRRSQDYGSRRSARRRNWR